MTVATVTSLVDTLHQHPLLEPAQLEQLPALTAGLTEPRALAKLLMQRDWLTPYQVNQLMSGKAQDLFLGPYVILQRLGEGGTGQVFKARHQRMRRIVAIKLIRRELLKDAEVLARFYREIRVASQVAHPHVVHAYDAGPMGNTHFLAMEYVKGTDLSRQVKESGPLGVDQAGDYIRQAAVGLQHIHEHGLIHRDIKPSNLLVTGLPSKDTPADGEGQGGSSFDSSAYPWGLVKILDLGLARFETQIHGELTGTFTPVGGVMMGTPDYLAPEQALDFHQADIRSDIYSLGSTFYYLLTGQPPFPGGTLAQKLLRHQQATPPPLEQFRSDVPSSLQGVLARMLAKQPADRYQTPVELVADLAACLRGGAPTTGSASEPSSHGVGPDAITTLLVPPPPPRSALPVAELASSVTSDVPLPAIPVAVFPEQPPRESAVTDSTTSVLSGAAPLAQPVSAVPTANILLPGSGWGRWLRSTAERLPRGLVAAIVGGLLLGGLGFCLFLLLAPSKDPAQVSASRPSSPEKVPVANIPAAERFNWQPKELAAVLGEHRMRHWGPVAMATFSPSGKELVSYGTDQTIRVWDVGTGRERAAYATQKSWVIPIAVASEGRLVLAGSLDNTFRLWDTVTGQERMTFKGHLNRIVSLGFAPDGKTVVSSSVDGTVRLWDMATGHEKFNIKRDQAPLASAVVVLPDNKTVVYVGAGNTVRLWDTSLGKERLSIGGQKVAIVALGASGDGLTVAAIGTDRIARVWDAATGKERASVAVQQTGVAALSPDGRTLASGGTDGTIKLWNVAGEAKELASFKAHMGQVASVSFSPDGRSLVSASWDGTLRLWDWAAHKEALPLQGHLAPVRYLAFSPDGRTVATSSGDRFVRLWDWVAGKERLVVNSGLEQGNDQTTSAVLFASPSPSPLCLLTSHSDGHLRFWDPATGKDQRAAFPVPGATSLQDAACSPNAKYVAAAAHDATIKIIDLATAREVATLTGHKGRVSHLLFTRDSQRVISTATDGSVRLWDAATGTQLAGFPASPGLALVLALSADGKTLAWGGGADHAVHLWDMDKQKELVVMAGHTGRITGLAFAPSLLPGERGRGEGLLVSTGTDGRVIVWDVEAKRSLHQWPLPGPVHTVAFAPDGKHIATGNSNGTAYIIRLNLPAPTPGS